MQLLKIIRYIRILSKFMQFEHFKKGIQKALKIQYFRWFFSDQ